MLNQPKTLTKVSHVVRTIKNNKSAASDSIVGEVIKYGGKPTCEVRLTLFNLVQNNEFVPKYWRDPLTVSLFLGMSMFNLRVLSRHHSSTELLGSH